MIELRLKQSFSVYHNKIDMGINNVFLKHVSKQRDFVLKLGFKEIYFWEIKNYLEFII